MLVLKDALNKCTPEDIIRRSRNQGPNLNYNELIKDEEIKKYKKVNKDILDFSLSSDEKTLFETYSDKTKEEITELKNELVKEQKETEKKLESDNLLLYYH